MEERDDVSLISVVSSVGEEDSYLSEPTYNNLDPVWAQRHGFGPGEDMILRSRASNKVREDFTITRKAPTMYTRGLLLLVES